MSEKQLRKLNLTRVSLISGTRYPQHYSGAILAWIDVTHCTRDNTARCVSRMSCSRTAIGL